jgi:LacI family transcriptional regulator
VASATREKILKAIDELGYKPNVIARSLRLQKTFTLGLILPDTYNPYFAEVVRGVEMVAFQRGYSVMLCHSNYDPKQEIQYILALNAERAAGVLWFPATDDPKPARLLADYGIPVVMLDRIVSGFETPSVMANNFLGGYLATQHLLALGHRLVGCITRPVELFHSQERLRGYRAALDEHGLAENANLIVRGGFRLEDGYEATKRLLSQQPLPSAIFAYNDIMAIGALRAAREMGLHVPQDLSVVGFDDIPQAAFTDPALTTVRVPKLEMGCRGAELLLEVIDAKNPNASPSPLLEVELIVRESTAARPNYQIIN